MNVKLTKEKILNILGGINNGILNSISDTKVSYLVVKNRKTLLNLFKNKEMGDFQYAPDYEIYLNQIKNLQERVSKDPKLKETISEDLRILEEKNKEVILAEKERQKVVKEKLNDELEVFIHTIKKEDLPNNITIPQMEILQYFLV